jgi:hypothetical protein
MIINVNAYGVLPGLGGAVGGAATGLVLRPAIRSMVRLLQNPALQHKLLSGVAEVGDLGESLAPYAMPAFQAGRLPQTDESKAKAEALSAILSSNEIPKDLPASAAILSNQQTNKLAEALRTRSK